MTTDIDSLAALLAADIKPGRLLDMSRRLIATPSVNPFSDPAGPGSREAEVAVLYASDLQAAGMSVERVEVAEGRPNLIGRLGNAAGPSLMLAGHLDTVGVNGYSNPFEPRVEGGRLYGRGSCDMKAALACFAEVSRILNESGIELGGQLLIGAIADEEDRMTGSMHFGQHGPKVDNCIVGEPSDLAICPAHKGQLGTIITTSGRAVHSSVPEEGINAIEKMGKVIAAFDGYHRELRAADPHPMCGTGSFNLGVINGGDIASTVADRCSLEVDRRLLPGETFDDVVEQYRSRLEPLTESDPEFEYEIAGFTMTSEALDTPLDHPVVAATVAASTWASGSAAPLAAFTGCTDAPNLGAPAVICGPGSLSQAHSLNEWVEIDQLTKATKIYLHAALAILA